MLKGFQPTTQPKYSAGEPAHLAPNCFSYINYPMNPFVFKAMYKSHTHEYCHSPGGTSLRFTQDLGQSPLHSTAC